MTPRPLALVTGASSGIGRDIATELARTGHDLAAMQAGQRVVIPGFVNRVQALLPRFLPRRVVASVVKRAQEPGQAHRSEHVCALPPTLTPLVR